MELSNGNAPTFTVTKVDVSNGTGKTFTVIKQEPILVRPAGQTFNDLYFLSNLDQTFPQPIEIVFSYKGSGIQQENATEVLKESLAKILVEFYPFAGCLTTSCDGKMLVRCTGEGVPFVEVVSDTNMEELGDISIADAMKLRKLIH